MKRLAVLMLLVSASTMVPGIAAAERTSPIGLREFMGIINGTIVIPPEWDGIWMIEDSTYDCTGAFMDTSAPEPDTLCAGAAIVPDDVPFSFTCSGSATATTVDVTCVGSEEIVPDCTLTFTYSLRGTRSGDTFFVVTTISQSYDGTAEGCDLIPDSCEQINNHAIRTGPAPPAYCATPALPSTWGELKVRYR
jgi:hypothetical protein